MKFNAGESSLNDSQKARATKLREEGHGYQDIAFLVGVHVSSVRRYLKGNKAPKVEPYKPGGAAHDRIIVGLRDEVSRLTKELKSAHRKELGEDEIRRILGTVGASTAAPPHWLIREKRSIEKPEVPVTIWSDWHGGEVVSKAEVNGVNEYNTEIMDERVRRLVERTIRLADKHAGVYPGIVINLLGDFISGGLHPELLKSDEMTAIEAVLHLRDLLVWAIEQIAGRFGKVYLPCASGNHGRMTQKPEFKGYSSKNYDTLIYKLLEQYFSEHNEDVRFDIRESNEVFYRVYNKRFLAMHGDMLGVKGGDGIIGALGPISRGEVKVRGSSASFGSAYDTLLIGHWHQSLWLPRVIVAGTLKGYDEFAKNALRAPVAPPSQPLFFVHPRYGITSRWEVYLENPAQVAQEWVSVFDAAKAA